ncbi:NIPSNAP family protein [Lysobacter niabensis]|uniref:NIPSNAP family protein n=1 Tax=Agrilutibacter niabensis TaxID=380628 RepID=UPI003622DFE0
MSATATARDGRHDFDFIHGRWQVQNERLKQRLAGSNDWEVFGARDECRPILDGIGNVEEFHTDWGGYEGMALRLYDLAADEWRIYWSSSRSGVLDPAVSGRFGADGVGTFFGHDQHEGRAVLVRFQWRHASANSAHWQQAFSVDEGASWEINWHMWFRRVGDDGRLLHDDAVVELRQYTLQPGQRDVLVELFEREFIETQEAVGMHVIGHFRDLDAPDRFVWLRGFPSMEARRDALQAFYFGPVWQQHREAANATMIDSDNVLLLKLARPDAGVAPATAMRPAPGAMAAAGALCIGVCSLEAPAEQGFAARFEQTLSPVLRELGAQVIARYMTDASENTFPRLPVREGERVFVWLARFADVAALDAHLAALRASSAWKQALATALLEDLAQPPELLRLAPTARSELR